MSSCTNGRQKTLKHSCGGSQAAVNSFFSFMETSSTEKCGRGRGLPACQVSSWCVQSFGHNIPTLQTGQTRQDRTRQDRTDLSVCNDRECGKNGWANQNTIWDVDVSGPKETCITWGSRFSHAKWQFWGRKGSAQDMPEHVRPSIFIYLFIIMAAVWNRTGHYIFALWFLSSSSSFFPRLISAVAEWMSTILRHMMWS